MKNPNDSFLKGRLRSLKFALRGAFLLITTEHSIMVQFSIAVLITIFGFVMQISATEWMFQLLAIGMVLVAESLNTGIEKLSDFVHPDYHKRIGFIKDISAGAATFAAIIAVIIGLIIYIPKFS
ncbi:diacylglycerol kinase family protein [Aureibaculum sp. A20]|uniref:Diacylglycerol kinase family protein n=1 Tax=Aureibaculum flavum TaxID=2795986 RepID=A0ABS0WUR2_9FLAO|nr:diacylglycerol kinase family protein [Aureibaculum flavum]MBJ2175725.1 diacylglycerol kinase family protein [Aureibaculum flavum]